MILLPRGSANQVSQARALSVASVGFPFPLAVPFFALVVGYALFAKWVPIFGRSQDAAIVCDRGVDRALDGDAALFARVEGVAYDGCDADRLAAVTGVMGGVHGFTSFAGASRGAIFQLSGA